MTDQARAIPPQTDPRFAEIFRRLEAQDRVLAIINGKIDKWFEAHSDFREDYSRQLAISLSQRTDFEKRIHQMEQTLFGASGNGGLVALVNRMFWIGAVAGVIYGTLIAPLFLSFVGFVAWLLWQIVIGKVVIP